MILQLEMLGDEKYKKSELMGFLKRLNKGALQIDGNELKEDMGKMAEVEKMEMEQVKAEENFRRMEEEWASGKMDSIDMADMIAKGGLSQMQPREDWDVNEMTEEERNQLLSTWNAVANETSRGIQEELAA